MVGFFLKPIVWNSNAYKSPSGDKASKGSFPGEHGYGHEEWNNSPAMEVKLNHEHVRAFNIQGLGKSGAKENPGSNFVFMYASHESSQYLVGVAGKATHLSDPERRNFAKRIKVHQFWKEVWALERVRKNYGNDRVSFLRRWNENHHWLPSWKCPASYFFWLDRPVLLDPLKITGKSKLLTMFASYTKITPKIAHVILQTVPMWQRDSHWGSIYGAVNETVNETSRDIEEINSHRETKETTRRALIDARIGQGPFRSELLKRWDAQCAVTSCTVNQVLRASHIKPWSESTNRERLDRHNGLLLSANLDALFDRGLISFTDDGSMLVSKRLPKDELKLLGVPKPLRYTPDESEKIFLAYHRDYWGL